MDNEEKLHSYTIKELAQILKRAPSTIATQVTKEPWKLPRRTKFPGSRSVRFLHTDVTEFIKEARERTASESR
jgi:predicted DNA-binding transcriptional regulator AlpA